MVYREESVSQNVTTMTHIVMDDFAHKFLRAEDDTQTPIPELIEAYELMTLKPDLIRKFFRDYVRILKEISLLSSSDLFIIENAYKTSSTKKRDKHLSLVDTLNFITPEQRSNFSNIASKAGNPYSPSYLPAMHELFIMMSRGHLMSESGKVPNPNDPESERLIWAHTQLKNSMTLVHFTIVQYLERFLTIEFEPNHGSDDQLFVMPKGWLVNALADLITLKYVKGEHVSDSIFDVWTTERSQGGLGWVSPNKVDSFKRVMIPVEA